MLKGTKFWRHTSAVQPSGQDIYTRAHRWPLGLYTRDGPAAHGPIRPAGRHHGISGLVEEDSFDRLLTTSGRRSCFNNSLQLLNFFVKSKCWKNSKSAKSKRLQINKQPSWWRRWIYAAVTIWRRVRLLFVWRRPKGHIRLRTMGNVIPCGGKIWVIFFF